METRVIYNASCPVCSREVDAYRRYADAKALPLRFEDIHTDDLADWGLTPDDAARRLHVVKGGRLLSGVPAFVALWNEMPRYRWLARLVSLPGVWFLAEFAYERILAPLLHAMHRRRVARGAAGA